jgi:hypothetical protein
MWDMPPRPRNNALFESLSNFVPSPMEPPPPTDEDIKAAFQAVLDRQAALSSSIERLRSALVGSPPITEIGPGHNQGPPLVDELDAEDKRLLVLLQDKGPRPSPADCALIVEQAEKTLSLSKRIIAWLGLLAVGGAKLGAYEVTKHLTEPLWADVAQKIVDLYHAIEAWLPLLPKM